MTGRFGSGHILIDTNASVAFIKRGDAEAVEILRHADQIGMSTAGLGELLSGFAAGRRETENWRELGAFLDSARVKLLPVEADTAEFYSRVYLALRRKGKPIPTNDLWIAATVLQHGAAVFSHDQHLHEVDRLIAGTQLAGFLL